MARSVLGLLAISMADNTDGVVVDDVPGVTDGMDGGEGEDLAGTDTVEAGLLDVAEADTAVDGEIAELEKTEDAHEALESIYFALEAYAKKGGVTKDVAVWVQSNIQSAIKGFPILNLQNIGQPSVESYRDGTRSVWLTNSLEGLGQMLKDFWAMIMKQINKVVAYIRNWYNKVLDAAPRLKKRAEALSEKANDTNGTAEAKKIDLSLMRVLSLKKKAVKGSELVSALGDIVTIADVVLAAKNADAYDTTMTSLLSTLDAVAEGGKGALDADTEAAKALKKTLNDHARTTATVAKASTSKTEDKRFEGIKAKIDVKTTGEILGNRAIFLKTIKDSYTPTSYKEAANLTGVEMASEDIKFDVAASGQFDVMSTSDCGTVADSVAKLCDAIIAYKKSWEGRDAQQKRMDNEVKKAINSADKDKDDTTKAKDVKDVANAITVGWRRGVAFETSFINFSISVGRASLSFVERSLAQYKKA